jgi:hypothetical protein
MAKKASRKFAVILGLLLFVPHQISNAKSGPPTTIATPADVIACNGPIAPGSPTIFGPAIPAPPSFDDACFGFSFTATVGTTLNFSNPTRSSSRTKQDKSAYHREAEQFTQSGRLVTKRSRFIADVTRLDVEGQPGSMRLLRQGSIVVTRTFNAGMGPNWGNRMLIIVSKE